MKKELFILCGWVPALLLCDFPYKPQRFELPEIPSPFIPAIEISEFIGTDKVKIAYTLREEGSRFIYFVDFSANNQKPIRLKKPKGREALHGDSPIISPEGTFVAYYLTAGADVRGAYIHRLNSDAEPVLISENGTEPHWWVDSAGKTYVIFSNQLISTSLDKGHYFTFRQQVSLEGNGSLIGVADTIAPYPMNGGLSADGRFLCTGYTQAAFYDLSTGTLIKVNEGVQVCNPSICPDPLHPDRMLFLNFYGVQNFAENTFAGLPDYPADKDGNLPLHAVCFIVDAGNRVCDYIPIGAAGKAYREWQDPEWSNDPDFAVALAVIDEGNADAAIIKNIGDGNRRKDILIITTGKYKLNYNSTPYLWIGK